MRDKFQITIESIHCENDRGKQKNVRIRNMKLLTEAMEPAGTRR